MPFETTIDGETGLRTHVIRGRTSQKEIEGALGQVYARPDFRPEADILCDVREADLRGMTRDIIKSIVGFVVRHRSDYPGVRTAIVVGRDLDFGLARMYEQLIEASYPVNVMVFRDADEARGWLESAAAESAALEEAAEG